MDPDELAAARRRELMRATAHLGPRRQRSPQDVPDITLAEFLLARLAEDEQVARGAMPGPWIDGYVGPEHLADGIVWGQASWIGHVGQACDVRLAHVREGNATHIARWDPARVLAEIAAKRAILDDHVNGNADWDNGDWADDDYALPAYCVRCEDRKRHDAAPWPCPTLRALALPYADHPQCHPSWLPPVREQAER